MKKTRELKIDTTGKTEEQKRKEIEAMIDAQKKEKNRAVLDQVLRFLGTITATVIFIVLFDILFEMSVFGLIGKPKGTDFWAIQARAGGVYTDTFGFGIWLPYFLMTIVFIGSMAGLVLLVTYYIRDLIAIIKSIIDTAKSLTKEATTNIAEGVGIDIDREKSPRERKPRAPRIKKEVEAPKAEAPKKSLFERAKANEKTSLFDGAEEVLDTKKVAKNAIEKESKVESATIVSAWTDDIVVPEVEITTDAVEDEFIELTTYSEPEENILDELVQNDEVQEKDPNSLSDEELLKELTGN